MTGSKTALRRDSWFWVGTLVVAAAVHAGDGAPPAKEEMPTMELLEFLGGWQDEEGNWIDPTEWPEMVTAMPPTGGEAIETGERDE